MADIELFNLTDSTNADNGTGVFDKLIQSVEQHIESQHKAGRITGTSYSDVYLGSMQSVLAESVRFLLSEQQAGLEADLLNEQILSEQKKNEPGGLIDLEKRKNQEQIDLIIAQTASQYESIDASRKDTNRKNLLNSKQVIKIGKETELLTTQNSELLLSGEVDRELKTAQKIATASNAIDSTNKANADVALTNSKEVDQIYVTTNIRPLEKSKIEEEIDASSKDTTRKNLLNSEQVIKVGKESELLTTQNSELLLNGVVERSLKDEQRIATTSGATDSTNKANADVALTNSKEVDQIYVTTNIRPLEKNKIEEEIDLLMSRDAEQLAATIRSDAESSKQVIKIEKESNLLTTKDSELTLNGISDRALKAEQKIATTSGAIDSTNRAVAEVDFTKAKETDQTYITTNMRPLELSKLQGDIDYANSKELDQIYVTTNIRPLEKSKMEEEIDLLQAREIEQLAATVRMDLESAKKVLLIEAQTLGFKVDGKQKLLKQMFEGFAIETTTNGAVTAPAPSLNSSASLELVANSIFDDLAPTEGTI